MGKASEVIQNDIEETRSHLADRITELGGKITGTVETVEETVEDVAETASDTVKAVKNAFNIQKQAQQHPWLVFGGAVLVGFLGERLLEGAVSRSTSATQRHPEPPTMGNGNGRSRLPYRQPPEEYREYREEPEEESGWLRGIGETFGSELNTLKGLAIGALFGLARDVVVRSIPQAMQDDVEEVFDDATQHAGGKPIHGRVLEGSEQESEDDDSDQEMASKMAESSSS